MPRSEKVTAESRPGTGSCRAYGFRPEDEMAANPKGGAMLEAAPEPNLVPALIARRLDQRDLILSARPSLPKQLGSSDAVRVEVLDREGAVVWSSEVMAGQIRERLADPDGAVRLVLPAESLPAGGYLVSFCRDEVPIFQATFEVVEAE